MLIVVVGIISVTALLFSIAQGLVCLFMRFTFIFVCVCICPFSDGLFIRAAPCALAQARGMHIFFVHEWRLAQLCQSL